MTKYAVTIYTSDQNFNIPKIYFQKLEKKILVKTFLAQHTNLTCKSLEKNFKNINEDILAVSLVKKKNLVHFTH